MGSMGVAMKKSVATRPFVRHEDARYVLLRARAIPEKQLRQADNHRQARILVRGCAGPFAAGSGRSTENRCALLARSAGMMSWVPGREMARVRTFVMRQHVVRAPHAES
jgi:hypothetical protein